MDDTATLSSDHAAVRDLEFKKADLLIEIRELQLELLRANVELYRLGVDEAIDIRSFIRR